MSVADANTTPAEALITPDDSVLLLIDHQPQMFFGTGEVTRDRIINASVGLAKAARLFGVPTIPTTVAAQAFSGPLIPQLADLWPDTEFIDRSTMNAWEDQRVVDAVKATGRTKLVIAGLWTEVCVAMPALCALEQGYEVYVVTDACGGVTQESHDRAIERIVQRGVQPLSWIGFLLELQRDWARAATYSGVVEIAEQHAGTYGLGLFYAHAMLPTPAAAG